MHLTRNPLALSLQEYILYYLKLGHERNPFIAVEGNQTGDSFAMSASHLSAEDSIIDQDSHTFEV